MGRICNGPIFSAKLNLLGHQFVALEPPPAKEKTFYTLLCLNLYYVAQYNLS